MRGRPTGKLKAGAAALFAPAEKKQPAAGNAFITAIIKAGAKQQDVEIWPENWPVWRLFSDRMRTQWRVGPGGAVGLDYGVLFRFLDRMGLSDVDYDQMLDDIGVLEDAALSEIHSETPS